MAQYAGFLWNLKMLFACFMLVARCAVYRLSFNLVLFFKMWFMGKNHFFSEFNLLGFEVVFRVAVTWCCHTGLITDHRPCFNRWAAKPDIWKTFRWCFRDMLFFDLNDFVWFWFRRLTWCLYLNWSCLWWGVVTLHASILCVFTLFPCFITFLDSLRIG